MKILFFGALTLLLSCTVASAQPGPGKSEAQLLFDKSRAAYAELKSYRGTSKTMSLSLDNGSPSIYGGSATINYQKSGLLRVDGKLAGGGDFSILGNGDGSWYRWPIENEGNWMKVEELGLAIASMTGVASRAPTTIPSLLIQSLGFGGFGSTDEAKLDGEEEVDGEMCFKLTAKNPKETLSWWIDKKSLLLRRIVSYSSEAQSAARMAQIRKQTEKADREAGREAGPEVETRFVSRIEEFEIEAINEPIDEKLFETPTAK